METASDERIFANLAEKDEGIVVKLYTDFIYRTFLKRFNRFFQIPKYQEKRHKHKRVHCASAYRHYEDHPLDAQQTTLQGLRFPFFDFNDRIYLNFMTHIFKSLELRRFPKDYYICYELDECDEILMVDKGFYLVGYNVNNFEYFTRLYGKSSIIGAYNVIFRMRQEFLIKTQTQMEAYAIRRMNMHKILQKYRYFEVPMKQKAISTYSSNIYFPLTKEKNLLIKHFG